MNNFIVALAGIDFMMLTLCVQVYYYRKMFPREVKE
jgi:hypothetical protein